VVPGTYRARLTVGDISQTRSFEVLRDPRVDATREELEKQFDLAMKVYGLLNDTQRAVATIRDVREQVSSVAGRIEGAGTGGGIQEAARTLVERLTAIEEGLDQTRSQGIQDPLNFPPQLDNQVLYLYGVVNSADAGPTAGTLERYRDLEGEVERRLQELDRLLEEELSTFNDRIRENELPAVIVSRE
jgi:hypothetical protein